MLQRDNLVYWKTNGKINNDLQWYCLDKSHGIVSTSHTVLSRQVTRRELMLQRDNLVYWKTNGKINNDLQWYCLDKSLGIVSSNKTSHKVLSPLLLLSRQGIEELKIRD